MTLRTIYGRMRTAVQSQRLTAGFYRFQLVGFSIVILGLSVSLSAAEPAKRMFNIEAKPAAQSLTDYAQQAHTQLGYDVDIVDGILTNAVVGEYDSAEALELLLENTGLTAEHGERGIFIRWVPEREVGGDIEERTPPVAQTNSLRFAQASAAEVHATVGQNQTSGRTGTDSGEDEEKRPLEEIIVTGTNIRGIAPESSPTRTFTREDVQISGAATAQDFIQTLPFNFGGGSNSDIQGSLPGDNNSGQNNVSFGALGSSVNLRGLGSGATLVLLNGHRVAPSSGIGDFTDISMIPASAIERVEVMNDGASSIYGGDAVAGVVNFILRDDFDGFETSIRYGLGTQHRSPEEFRAGVTGGLDWDSGHALLFYEYFNQAKISVADRTYSQGALLPNYLQPSQERHSVLASFSQSLTTNLKTLADFTFSTRDAKQKNTNNPGQFRLSQPSWDTLSISASGVWEVSDSWAVDFSGTYSATQGTTTQVGILPFVMDPFIRRTDSTLWTGDIKTSGPIIRLPGDDLKLAIGGHFRKEDFAHVDADEDRIVRDASRDVYAVFAEAFMPIVGPSNRVPGIRRLEINASGRLDDYSDFGATVNPKVGVLWSPVESLNLRGSYSTSFNPPPLGRVGAFDTNVSIYTRAFVNDLFGFTPADPSIADVLEIQVAGTSPSLDPETSRTITAGLDFQEDWGRRSLSFSIGYFDIEFENRLANTPPPFGVSPFDAPNIAFNNPELFPEGSIIFSPSQDQINDVIENADQTFFFDAGPDDLPSAQIINNMNVTRNLSRTLTSGFDFEIDYTFESDVGVWTLGFDATVLSEFKQQAAVTTPVIDLANTLYRPVDLKVRSRAGYARGGFTANMFVNYTDDYHVDNTDDASPVDSWTTIDLSLAFDTGTTSDSSVLNDTTFRLSVANLFDEDPPSAPFASGLVFGFDPANASPLGRFIAIELTKQF